MHGAQEAIFLEQRRTLYHPIPRRPLPDCGATGPRSKPDPGSITFTVKPAKDADAADLEVAEQVRQMQQSSFLEDPLTPLERPEFAFGYRFTSAGHPHDPLIHDWEVQEAFRQYKRRYGADALDHLKRMYGQTIPARNLHLVMGTMLAHPRTFIVIGLLRSGLDPAELAKQGDLF